MAAETDCAATLRVIDGIIKEPAFVERCKQFVDGHCDVFSNDTENKLEYTPIHNEYMQLVEAHIEQGLVDKLGPEFSMERFMEALPEFIGDESQTGSESASSETIDFLLGFGDMDGFKDMMLVAKKDKNLQGLDIGPVAGKVAFSNDQEKVIEEARAICNDLVNSFDANSGWTLVSDKPWCKVERRTKDGSEFIRCQVVVDIPPEEAKIMLTQFNAERDNWDAFCHDTHFVEEINGPDDYLAATKIQLPMMKAREVFYRIIISKNVPAAGCFTYFYLEYDQQTKQLKPASAMLGAGSISPVEGEPGKALITAIDQIESNWIPKFLMNWMITTYLPKMMTKMTIKYKKYKGV